MEIGSKYSKYLFLAIAVLATLFSFSQEYPDYLNTPYFHRITNDDGLSQGSINAIAQDDKGFIWIGTNDGLNRFDGMDFLVFRNDIRDTNSISSSEIIDIQIDYNGILWIGTGRGVNIFNPETGQFKLVAHQSLNSKCAITVLEFQEDSLLWIGTKNHGLFRLNIDNGNLKSFTSLHDENNIPSNHIHYLFYDSKKRLWAGFYNGEICYFDSSGCHQLNLDFLKKEERIYNRVTAIAEDKNQRLWFATYGRSLQYLDPAFHLVELPNETQQNKPKISLFLTTAKFENDKLLLLGTEQDGLGIYDIESEKTRYFRGGDSPESVSYRTVNTLFTDRTGNLWIGTKGKGLNILSPRSQSFSVFSTISPGKMALRFSSVRCILRENDSILWIGGYQGLQKFNLKTRKTCAFLDIIPYTLCVDQADSNLLWIGTEGTGIYLLNKSTLQLSEPMWWSNFERTNGPPPMDPGGNISKISNLDDDNLIIGTNVGLHILNKSSKTYRLYTHNDQDPNSIVPGNINDILFDNEKILVCSMRGQLAQFDINKDKFKRLNLTDKDFPGGFSRINGIFKDHQHNIWLGTNNGAIMLDKSYKPQRQVTMNDGLPNNTIYTVLDDGTGHLWMSTNFGISKFNPDNGEVSNFNKSNGLPCNEFNSAAYYEYKNWLYFGGVDGVACFDPRNITETPVPDDVVVTEAEVIGNGTQTDYTVAYTDHISLTPAHHMLRLSFSALNFTESGRTNFAFRLDDQEGDWVELGNSNSLTIKLSKPGLHTLAVMADNGNGFWMESPTVVSIMLNPEFYQTNWFKALVLVLIISLLASVYFIRINIIKQQRNKLEKLVKERTNQLRTINEELEDANRSKDMFLSVIAHDLRSPFNSLIGFSDILEQDWNELNESEKKEFISLIRQTADDTYQMLINLLEWARLQKKQVDFSPHDLNLKMLAAEALKQLNGDAFFKNIRIVNQIEPSVSVYADTNMLNSVMRNLISNAIKFTPKNGSITIAAKEKDKFTFVSVEDTGVGMTRADAQNLFKLQYRNSATGTEGEKGTGLGLVLCHEFVKKHGGNIQVESEPGKGSTFTFSIPQQQNGGE